MDNAQQFSLLVGAFMPFILAIILREHWSETRKSILAFAACVAAGLAGAYVTSQLSFANTEQVTTDVLLVLGMAYGTYREFWKPTGIASAVNLTIPYKIVPKNAPSLPADLMPEPAPVAPETPPTS